MMRFVLFITLAAIPYATLRAAPVVEVFKRQETRVENKKRVRVTYVYGLYAAGFLDSERGSDLMPKIQERVRRLVADGHVAAPDVFLGAGFVLVLPQKPQQNPAVVDALHEIMAASEELGVKPADRINPSRAQYVREASSPGPTTDVALPTAERREALARLHAARGRLASLQKRREALQKQLANYRRYRPQILALLRGYKSFDELYDDLVKLKPAIEASLRNPNAKSQLKDLISALHNPERYFKDFQASHQGSQTRRFPNRWLSYNELYRLVYARREDASLRMMKKYLLVLNFIFLNPRELSGFDGLCTDPYSEVPVLRVENYRMAMERQSLGLTIRYSASVTSSYAMIEFFKLATVYGFGASNMRGKEGRFMFQSDRPAFSIESLRNMEPLLTRNISEVGGEIAAVEKEIAGIPGVADYARVATADVEADYWLAENLARARPTGKAEGAVKEPDESGSSESPTEGDRAPMGVPDAAVEVAYPGSVTRLFGRKPGAYANGLRRKYRRARQLDLLERDGKWWVVGRVG